MEGLLTTNINILSSTAPVVITFTHKCVDLTLFLWSEFAKYFSAFQ